MFVNFIYFIIVLLIYATYLPPDEPNFSSLETSLLFLGLIPKNLSIDDVLETCHKECIKVEDEYDLFILPKVVYEQ